MPFVIAAGILYWLYTNAPAKPPCSFWQHEKPADRWLNMMPQVASPPGSVPDPAAVTVNPPVGQSTCVPLWISNEQDVLEAW